MSKTSKPYWKRVPHEWEGDCFVETKTSVETKIPKIKKTSKEKVQLEAYINKFADQYHIEREYKFHPDRRRRFDWAILCDCDFAGKKIAQKLIALFLCSDISHLALDISHSQLP